MECFDSFSIPIICLFYPFLGGGGVGRFDVDLNTVSKNH